MGVHQAWYWRVLGFVVALRGPRNEPLFSERNRFGVRVIPLLAGWRITIRKVGL